MADFDLYQQQIAQQQRRAQMAQMLLQQGMQQEPTQMAGNIAIRQSPIAGLVKGLMSYQGAKGIKDTDAAIADLAQQRDAADREAYDQGMQLFNAGDKQGAMTAFGKSPKGQAYAAELMKSQLTPEPAEQRTFEWLETQPQSVRDAYKEYKTAGQGDYNTPIATSEGYYSYNNRRGGATPIVGKDGRPIMPVPADAIVRGNVAKAEAVGTGTGQAQVAPLKAKADAAAAKQVEAEFSAPTALSLMDDFEKAVKQQPTSAMGRAAQQAMGYVGAGDETQQNAIAAADTAASQLMAYANKLPGPASDKDRIDFKASIGAFSEPGATKGQKLAAIAQARKSFQNIVNKYGGGAAPAAAPAGGANRFKIEVVQ